MKAFKIVPREADETPGENVKELLVRAETEDDREAWLAVLSA
jgi:hypothetical protein